MFKTASWDAADNAICNKMFQNPKKGKIKNKFKNEFKNKNKLGANNLKTLNNVKPQNKMENTFIVKSENMNGNQSSKKNKNSTETLSKGKNDRMKKNKEYSAAAKKVKKNLSNNIEKVSWSTTPPKMKNGEANKNVIESKIKMQDQNKNATNVNKTKKKKKNKLKLKDQITAGKISKLEILQEKQAKIQTNTPPKDPTKRAKKAKLLMKLKETIQQTQVVKTTKQTKPVLSLREKMMAKLKSARFRYLNEQIYTTTSKEAQNIFKTDPDAFQAYHEGYRQQVERWPLNPVDNIITTVKKMPKNHVIADFGCGDAKLAKCVSQKVHSFDLVAGNELVTACDMAHVPLPNKEVDVVVFCLSLMGTNLHEYLKEANRVLKVGGILKIAEVESRFDDVDMFIKGVETFGFKKCSKDLSHKLFYFLDFKKASAINNKKKLPALSLQPCMYKKR